MSENKFPNIEEYIEVNPEIKDGQAVVKGTGCLVKRIAGWYTAGLSPEEIAAEYPHLNLEQVFAALTYYQVHRKEIDDKLHQEEMADPSFDENVAEQNQQTAAS